MAGALDGKAIDAKVYSHQDVTGVGYGIASFYPTGADDTRHFSDNFIAKLKTEIENTQSSSDEYVKLARKSLESYILKGKVLDIPTDLPKEMMTKQAGAFVSIHKAGRLRGCIGTILPTTECLAKEIIQNAISASTRDTRFNPISPEELPDLDINVDVLMEPELINISHNLEFI